MGKVAIITGISGQDGSYLAELLLIKPYKVIMESLGILSKKYLKNLRKIKEKLFLKIDINNYSKIKNLIKKIKPSEYILSSAAQSFINYKFEDEFFKLNPNIKWNITTILSAIQTIFS